MTDGVKALCDWTDKRTVGWQKLGRPVSIIVDLGDVKAISGVSYRTASGENRAGAGIHCHMGQ